MRGNSVNDLAALVAKFGQERIHIFTNMMINLFGPNIKVGCKDGVLRIAEKIKGIMLEENLPANRAWAKLTDTMRL